MPIVASDNSLKFTPCPPGTHQGVCVDVIDHGLVRQEFGGKAKQVHKVTLRWQVAEINAETGQRFEVQKRYTLSLNEKATLRKDLEAWRGSRFTKEELAGFDLERLLGANCQLAVVHSPSKTDPARIYANVQTIMALGKGMQRLEAEDYVREQDRVNDEPAPAEPEIDDERVEF